VLTPSIFVVILVVKSYYTGSIRRLLSDIKGVGKYSQPTFTAIMSTQSPSIKRNFNHLTTRLILPYIYHNSRQLYSPFFGPSTYTYSDTTQVGEERKCAQPNYDPRPGTFRRSFVVERVSSSSRFGCDSRHTYTLSKPFQRWALASITPSPVYSTNQ
jgi:hypothetical protein